MAEAVEKLRTALLEYRTRPRAFVLRKAMAALKEALPSAFDEDNEKKNEPHAQTAYDLYQDCEEVLQSARTSTGSKRKRSMSEGEVSDAIEDTKCALFSLVPFPFAVVSTQLRLDLLDLKRSTNLLRSNRRSLQRMEVRTRWTSPRRMLSTLVFIPLQS